MNVLDRMKADYKKANAAYHNGKSSGLTDAQFDKLEAAIRRQDPKWPELKKTGAKIAGGKKTKVKLVEYAPSLDKFYPEGVGKKLKSGVSLLEMDKLDGSALQIVLDKGIPIQVATRGNGIVGQDISFLIPQLRIPKSIKAKGHVVLRCEAVMKEAVFQAKYASKYDNSRNLVAGVLNRKSDGTVDPILKHVDIVVLGVYSMGMKAGLAQADSWGFDTVFRRVQPAANLTASKMEARLAARKKESNYEMDGLVLCKPDWYLNYQTNDRPKDIWAFKVNTGDETHEAKVLDVIYQISGHGRINPKIKLVPTRMGGVMVQHATVHNAEWMTDRKIGIGAVVQIVRSGGVIPKVVGVVKAAKTVALPSIPYVLKGKFFFVDKRTGAITDAATDGRITTLQIAKFMDVMGVDLLAGKTIEKLLPRFPSVEKYLKDWKAGTLADNLHRAGLGPKVALNIHKEFDKVFKSKVIPMRQLMVASSIFKSGMGDRKLQILEQAGVSMGSLMALLLLKGQTAVERKVIGVKGFSDKTGLMVGNGCTRFRPRLEFYSTIMKIDGKLPPKGPVVRGDLEGQFVSFTSYRSPEHEAAVKARGAQVVSYGAKTTILLYKDGRIKFKDKIDKAMERGVRVSTFESL